MGKSVVSSAGDPRALPNSPDVAVRQYGQEVARHQAALERAIAGGADESALEPLREVLVTAEAMLGRARAWAERSERTRTAQARDGALPATGRRRSHAARPAPRIARDEAVEVGERVVADPYDPTTFITASVNRRVDVLAAERAAGRITEAQFLVGRMIQAVYERGSGARLGSGGWMQGGSRDQTVAHELAIIFAIEDAQKVRKFTARLEQAIGSVGTRFLRAILAEGQTFGAYALARGRSGDRAAGEVAQRFRWLLEALTEAQHAARGRAQVDAEGERVVHGARVGGTEETDIRGVVVPAGRGYRWGR